MEWRTEDVFLEREKIKPLNKCSKKTNNIPNYVERFKVPTVFTGSKLSIFSQPGKITGYWITTRSFPYRDPYCPGQYGPRLRLRPIWVSLF
jgi:hypothetical protein